MDQSYWKVPDLAVEARAPHIRHCKRCSYGTKFRSRSLRACAAGALLEFLLHGVQVAFYPERGGVARGMPTAHAAAPLAAEIAGDDLPPVWPDPEGTVRGETLEPRRELPESIRSSTSSWRWSTPSGSGAPASGSWPSSTSRRG